MQGSRIEEGGLAFLELFELLGLLALLELRRLRWLMQEMQRLRLGEGGGDQTRDPASAGL